jgi:CIC family chloride channel protein
MGLVAVTFILCLYKSEDLFDHSHIPPLARTMVGGLIVGLLLLVTVEVYGTGFEVMYRLLHETTAWHYLALLFVAKRAATCATLGSGASGGIFSPSLFLGVVTGGLFGHAVHTVFPEITATPEAYAMVGMGAVVAGTTHAPVTAILILFELTGDYQIILPVMIACTLSTVTARYLHPHSIYSLKLARKGVTVFQGHEETIMRAFHVADVMHSPAPSLPENASFQEVVERFLDTQDPQYYLVDAEHRLTGVVYLHGVKEFLGEGNLEGLVIARDLARPVSVTAHPHETRAECLRKFSATELDRLPVTDGNPESRKLLGVGHSKTS